MTNIIPIADHAAPDFSVIFNLLPVPVLIVAANHPVFTCRAVNQAFADLSGRKQSELVGLDVLQLLPNHRDDLNWPASYQRVIATRAPDRIPPFRWHSHGSCVRYFTSENTPVFSANGQLQYILQSFQDANDHRFRQVVDQSGAGFVVANRSGDISYVNPAARHLLGDPGCNLTWEQLTPSEWKDNQVAHSEKVYVANDGRRVPVLIAASLLEAENGDTEVAACIVKLPERPESENPAFLLRLDDAIRSLARPEEVMKVVTHMLGEYMHADRCGYCMFQPDEEGAEIAVDYTAPGVHSIVGRYLLSQFGEQAARLFRANLPDVEEDTQDAHNAPEAQSAYRQAGIRAHASVPLHKGGKLVAAIGVHQMSPRKWRPEEVALIRDVANRCWESIERVRASLALRSSEQRLRLAQKVGRIGTFEWLMQENSIIWGPELELLYGLPEGAFEGNLESWSKRVVPEDAERVLAGIENCLAQAGTEYTYEFRVMLPEGGHRWLRGQAQFFYGASGPDRMIGVNIDIDEQKAAEAHLRQQWQTFDTVLSNIPDAIYVFDAEFRLRYANRTLLSRLQRSLEDVVGKEASELGYPPEIVARIEKQIQEVFVSAESVRDEASLTQTGGGNRYYEYILVPVLGIDGKTEAVAGSTRDITERKLAEEQERKSQEQLRESARLESLGVMAGGIAHDFNNLLTGILGNASLLAELGTEQDAPFARSIVLAAKRAAELTSQMLAYSGRGHFVIEVLDLNTLVRDNLTLLRASLPRTVKVELDLGTETCAIEGDRSQMQQVVMNLILNAAEATADRPGRVWVRTSIAESAVSQVSARLQTVLPSGRYVALDVIDNGSGMSPETLKRMFDPFFTTKFTGRGLGLAAVLGIVKGHAGDIEVQSEEGKGTHFRLLFPATGPAPGVAAAPVRLAAIPNRNKKVLVVDDEELVRQVAKAALESRGLRVVEASGGPEALELLRGDADITTVILDLSMPVMSGEEALPLLQAVNPGAAFILSSGYSETEVASRFESRGVAGFLQKPYTLSAIVDLVTQVLGRNAA